MARKKKEPVKSICFLEIINLTHTGKQVIVFSSGEWKHLWIKGQGSASVLKPYKASSSMTEMVKRRQIELREIER